MRRRALRSGHRLEPGNLALQLLDLHQGPILAPIVQPAAFRLLSGEADLTNYQFLSKRDKHLFCRHCGVRSFGIGTSPRWGEFYAVNVTCLDDVTSEELINAPITYLDGRNDNWDTPPAETRHL